MPKTKIQKQEVIKKLKDKLSASGFVAFLNFHGLSVAKSTEFRRVLRKLSGDYIVAKKTLFLVALRQLAEGSELKVDKKNLEGEVGAVLAGKNEDVVLAVAKEVASFSKKNSEMLKIIGGIWSASTNWRIDGGGGEWIDADQIKKLAAILPRDALLTQLAFILIQPIAGLARILKEVEIKINTTP